METESCVRDMETSPHHLVLTCSYMREIAASISISWLPTGQRYQSVPQNTGSRCTVLHCISTVTWKPVHVPKPPLPLMPKFLTTVRSLSFERAFGYVQLWYFLGALHKIVRTSTGKNDQSATALCCVCRPTAILATNLKQHQLQTLPTLCFPSTAF